MQFENKVRPLIGANGPFLKQSQSADLPVIQITSPLGPTQASEEQTANAGFVMHERRQSAPAYTPLRNSKAPCWVPIESDGVKSFFDLFHSLSVVLFTSVKSVKTGSIPALACINESVARMVPICTRWMRSGSPARPEITSAVLWRARVFPAGYSGRGQGNGICPPLVPSGSGVLCGGKAGYTWCSLQTRHSDESIDLHPLRPAGGCRRI